MRAYVITVIGNAQSEASVARLMASHQDVGNEFELEEFHATTPNNVDAQLRMHKLKWTWPWEGFGEAKGMRLHAYKTKNRKARMACFMSHYRLWRYWTQDQPILILEDDALFINKLDPAPLIASEFWAIGINDPRGATRKASEFHAAVQKQLTPVAETPWIDKPEVPQGLAGASAYLIKPEGAAAAVKLADEVGAWPNDALLCRQLCPWLGVTRIYYTAVQGTPSTL